MKRSYRRKSKKIRGGINTEKCYNEDDPMSLNSLADLTEEQVLRIKDPSKGPNATGKHEWCFEKEALRNLRKSTHPSRNVNPLTRQPWNFNIDEVLDQVVYNAQIMFPLNPNFYYYRYQIRYFVDDVFDYPKLAQKFLSLVTTYNSTSVNTKIFLCWVNASGGPRDRGKKQIALDLFFTINADPNVTTRNETLKQTVNNAINAWNSQTSAIYNLPNYKNADYLSKYDYETFIKQLKSAIENKKFTFNI